jgi:hypothetical protein
MRMRRGFIPKLRQPNEPSKYRALTITRFVTSDAVLIGVRRLISAGTIVAAFFACATVEPLIPVEPGVAFLLPVGKVAAFGGIPNTMISFKQVHEDSRCAVDVTCVWAGDAKIEVTIARYGHSPNETRILSLTAPNNETTWGDVRIRFVNLTPVPRQSDGNAPRAYVAQLIVNRI